MQKRWYTNGEIYMPAIYGICFTLALAILERALNLPLIVGIIGTLGGVIGAGVSTWRFFAKTTRPLPGR